MNIQTKNILILTLTAVTVVGGYFFLRYAYKISDSMPFTQEIVLIFLGTIATILITALLLNKQTEVEIQKEQNIKFLELKANTYEHLINKIEEISISKTVTEDDIVRMQFITHKLAIFASPSVLEEYFKFLEALNLAIKDRHINRADSEHLSTSLANLTVKIRQDLIGESDTTSNYKQDEIKRQILQNSSESMELSKK